MCYLFLRLLQFRAFEFSITVIKVWVSMSVLSLVKEVYNELLQVFSRVVLLSWTAWWCSSGSVRRIFFLLGFKMNFVKQGSLGKMFFFLILGKASLGYLTTLSSSGVTWHYVVNVEGAFLDTFPLSHCVSLFQQAALQNNRWRVCMTMSTMKNF